MLLGLLGATFLENMLAGKGDVRAGFGSKRSSFLKNLLPSHHLTNFEIQKYYQIKYRFNGIALNRVNLPNQIKDSTYMINLDEYYDFGAHWIALHLNAKS